MPRRVASLLRCIGITLLAVLCAASPTLAAAGFRLDPDPDALAAAMATRRSVLLGEVHDNAEQHALRVNALRRLVARGARPAIAFEQFDHLRQADIERSRRERPGDADALIAAAGAGQWQWAHYRPFVQLALEYDLPIIAANLSRAEAAKIAAKGWDAVFDSAQQDALGLDHLPAAFIAAHERAVSHGHCDLLPAEALRPMAQAQIARDVTLAQAVRPYLAGGVVLLTGNGHVRRDLGVPYWLRPSERAEVLSIALLERTDEPLPDEALQQRFDAVVETPAAERPDPCTALRARLERPGKP